MRGRAIPYSAAELAWVQANAELPCRVLHLQFVTRFARQDVALVALANLRKRNGWKTGRTGRFEKGQIPPNKGKTGYCAPGSEKGWFRKGERRGVATRLYKPIGTERLSKNGYLERKIHDGLPLQSRWRAVHLLRWEETHGPVPKGCALKCLDGDKLNTEPANWLMVSRAMLPRLAGGNGKRALLAFDDAAPELKPVILAAARLEHAVRERRRGES